MAESPRIPTNDAERAVQSYQTRMTPLAKAMSRWTDRLVDAMRNDLKDLLERTAYDPLQSQAWSNQAIDMATINRLQALAEQAPASIRKRTVRDIIRRIASGTLTRRKAVRELFRLNVYAVIEGFRDEVSGILVDVAEEGMYRGLYMLQKSSGVGWSVDRLGETEVRRFVGQRFTQQSAWNFLRPSADMALKEFEQGMTLGSTPEQMDARLKDIKATGVWRAKREARTDITQTASDAHMDGYKRAGADKYEFIATFDERTCPTCGRLDHKAFNVADAKPGVNYPPMHPNCRCTTVAALSPEIKALMGKLHYTDRATGITHEISQDFSYEDWYKTFGPGRTDGIDYVPKYGAKSKRKRR